MKDAALILCPAQIVQFALIGMTFLDRQSVFSLFLSSFFPFQKENSYLVLNIIIQSVLPWPPA